MKKRLHFPASFAVAMPNDEESLGGISGKALWSGPAWFRVESLLLFLLSLFSLPEMVGQARVLEWVAISFSRGSSRLRDRAQVSRIADRRFTFWATRQAWSKHIFRRSETESKSLAVPMESISLLKSLSYDLRVWLLLQIQRKWAFGLGHLFD